MLDLVSGGRLVESCGFRKVDGKAGKFIGIERQARGAE